MTNTEIEQFAQDLLHADSEEQVIKVLTDAGYWHRPEVWRLYGGRSGSFATIGNQQSRPEAALVEKIVNSVDARLMNECLCAGINPASSHAPQSIRGAVAWFFEHRESDGECGGTLQNWTPSKRTEEAANITVAATGPRRKPCLTIADLGEGQAPDRMHDTFLSIDRENKLLIPFVQGKFNMGGTGALKFCGQEKLQLVITRRNPAIVQAMGEQDADNDCWGITVVRRERPKKGVGCVPHSMYTYLAPLDADRNPRQGRVLRFRAASMAFMPRRNQPYKRPMEWGTVIKLYEYDMKGFTSHILMKDGLLFRLETLLPEIALPVRMHECRDYGGKEEASFETTLAGLTVRLEQGRGGNLEEGYPDSVPFKVKGQSMVAKIYAFSKGRADTYRTNEGIIFTINGQTHGAIHKNIFARNSVKMGRLADSLIVTVDCSDIAMDAREDLFMNSRDRLSAGDLRKAVEGELEEIIARHHGLRKLRDERRHREIADRLQDSKPLEEVLESILKSSPSLASLFLTGTRLSQPHRRQPNGKEHGNGEGNGDEPYVGKPHPTYFRYHRMRHGDLLERNVELGRRCRLKFETDVVNDYFSRADFPGRYDVEIIEGYAGDGVINHSLTLHDGIANWSIDLPDDLEAGDKITVQCSVADDVVSEPFINLARLTFMRKTERPGGKNGRRSSRGGSGENGTVLPSGIQMPTIRKVNESEWREHEFDQHAACKIIQDVVGDDDNDDENTVYTFYINVDNIYLRTDMKHGREDPQLVEAKFIYGNVLTGLALVHDRRQREKRGHSSTIREAEEDNGTEGAPSIEESVRCTTRALAPFMVPMIDYLGALSSEDVQGLGQTGDDE